MGNMRAMSGKYFKEKFLEKLKEEIDDKAIICFSTVLDGTAYAKSKSNGNYRYPIAFTGKLTKGFEGYGSVTDLQVAGYAKVKREKVSKEVINAIEKAEGINLEGEEGKNDE